MSSTQNLHDIVEVEAVSWWPPAWGWWVLGGVLVAVAVVLGCTLARRRQRHRAQNLALLNLRQAPASMAQITLLTKQAALAYYSRSDIAALSGERWFNFLIQTMPQGQQANFAAELRPWSEALYASSTPPVEDYQHLMQRWVKQALPPKSAEVPDV